MWPAVENTATASSWVALAMMVVAGTILLASLAISLRGSKPDERPDIIKALAVLLQSWRRKK
ncbi:hypothetical protein [Streptomyces sp. NPDC002172]